MHLRTLSSVQLQSRCFVRCPPHILYTCHPLIIYYSAICLPSLTQSLFCSLSRSYKIIPSVSCSARPRKSASAISVLKAILPPWNISIRMLLPSQSSVDTSLTSASLNTSIVQLTGPPDSQPGQDWLLTAVHVVRRLNITAPFQSGRTYLAVPTLPSPSA